MSDAAQPARHPDTVHIPPCNRCRHLAISHDPRLPYWCRRIQIRTRTLPGIEVWRADGQPCRGFEARSSAR